MLSTMIILSFRLAVENLNLRAVGSSPTLGAYFLFFFFFFLLNMKVHGTPVTVLKYLSHNGI